MKKIRTKVGDVFALDISKDKKKYFQYIGNDLTQLNSDVIRAFTEVYPLDSEEDVAKIVQGVVDFYAHCTINLGLRMNLWQLVGHSPNIGSLANIQFRDTSDYGNRSIKKSTNWWIWNMNEEQRFVGALEEPFQRAEIGLVINPNSLVHRFKTGEYDFPYYPEY